MKGSNLHPHTTFVSLRPNSWFGVLELDSSPLQYELGLEDVYQEAIDVSFKIGHEWAYGILVETLEPI